MSDPVRPHRQQPTRLPHPWDSPGKNTEWVRCFIQPLLEQPALGYPRPPSLMAGNTYSPWIQIRPQCLQHIIPTAAHYLSKLAGKQQTLSSLHNLMGTLIETVSSTDTFLQSIKNFNSFFKKLFIYLFDCAGSYLQHMGSLVVA